jgi:pimeloyl-ACP methyl ester carboxylesterase
MNLPASASAALVVLGLAVTTAAAAEVAPPVGFQAEQRVRESTRLDWEFVAGPPARLPAGYDSRRLRYQLFVPEDYKATSTWPLVVFVSPGDAPLGWKSWEKPCEDAGWLYAAAVGAGNDCPPAQRVRSVCDVIDDVRRHYRVDPDRTYLAGQGGGAALAFRLAATLPEWFGGVILLGGDGELPASDHLRERLRERLSVALVCGADDRARGRLEKFQLPLLTGLGVRARLWVVPDQGHALPPPTVLAQVQRWLEEDHKRRVADSRLQGTSADETPSRLTLAGRALAQAKEELLEPAQTYRAVARLKWLTARFGPSQAGRQAQQLLGEIRDDPVIGRRLREQSDAASRRLYLARAAALEKSGRLAEARRAWEVAGSLADTPAGRRQSATEVRRLMSLMARTPYLGLTLEGDTTVVRAAVLGGPAQQAGLRPRDRLEQVSGVKVDSPAAVRRQVERCKPGDALAVVVSRRGRSLTVAVKVGAVPVEE